MKVDDHVKKQWILNEGTGESEEITRIVPRTQAIKSYLDAACIIDVHNHLRHGSLHLEDPVGTNDWWFRCFCTVLGIIEVDAYKVYCCFNQHSLTPSHKKFLDSLVMQLLSNNQQGAPVQTAYTASSRKRSIESVEEEAEDQEVECSSETHDVLPLSQYIAEVRRRGHTRECMVVQQDVEYVQSLHQLQIMFV